MAAPQHPRQLPPPPTIQGVAPLFVSFGPTVLDQLKFSDGSTKVDVPGGAGLYATLGARLVTSQHASSNVGCVVVAGNDFPQHVVDEITSWDMSLVVDYNLGKASTRGELVYRDETLENRSFRFLTRVLSPHHHILRDHILLRSFAYHFLETPEDLTRRIESLHYARAPMTFLRGPRLIWEPRSSHCRPDRLGNHVRACRFVHVFSPNQLDLIALVQGETGSTITRGTIEQCVGRLFDNGVGQGSECLVVVRCGKHGCFVASRRSKREWFPPYHTDQRMVVDTTGGGHAFLGGFAVGLQMRMGDTTEAGIYGTVAASFVFEQSGLPTRSTVNGVERWNWENPLDRIRQYRARLAAPQN